jgi:ATP-binding cassette subfamily B protein
LQQAGLCTKDAHAVLAQAGQDESWRTLAALDAVARALKALARAGAIHGQCQARAAAAALLRQPENIPAQFWSVCDASADIQGEPQLLFRGAVLLRAIGRKKDVPAPAMLPPELAAAVSRRGAHPIRELWRLLTPRDWMAAAYLLATVPIAVGGLLLEALLFRGLFDFASQLHTAGQRIAAMAALITFSAVLLLLELTAFRGSTRLCRHLELRLRVAFLEKIPRLGDRYFQSRLISDMGERCHAAHKLRNVIDYARQMLAALAEILTTAAGMIWLEPATAPFVLFAVAAAILPSSLSRSILAESDLRVRSHAAALTRFYLDSALGFSSIRSHGAEENVQRSHGQRLGDWIYAAVRLQGLVVTLELVQTLAMFGAIGAMFLLHPLSGSNAGRLLLVAYWALNLPTLGQTVGVLARQYPYYRSHALELNGGRFCI